MRLFAAAVAASLLVLTVVHADAVVRAHTGTVEVSPGRTLFYREVGKGPVVLLVHGAFLDYQCWDRTADALSAQARVIAISRYGHYPDSTGQDSLHYTFEQNTADVLNFIRLRKLGPVHLVGHSYGTVVAMLAVIQAPELVRSVTLVEPYAVSLIADSSARAAFVASRREVLRKVAEAPTADLRLRALIQGIVGREDALAGLDEEKMAMMRRNARTGPWLNKPQPVLSCASLTAYQGPALVVLGGSTAPVFTAIADGWTACVPQTRRTVIEGAGHLVMWDRPDDLARTIAAFVQNRPGSR